MAIGGKKAFNGLLETYHSLGESTGTIVRNLMRTSDPDARSKLVQELRSLDGKRLELLDQMDGLAKST